REVSELELHSPKLGLPTTINHTPSIARSLTSHLVIRRSRTSTDATELEQIQRQFRNFGKRELPRVEDRRHAIRPGWSPRFVRTGGGTGSRCCKRSDGTGFDKMKNSKGRWL